MDAASFRLTAAAFEAYLNYLGEEILPHVWKDERRFFSSESYRGHNGKLKRIAEELKWLLPPKSSKPLAGVIELQSLRDKMVHARPKKKSYRRVHKADQFAPVPATWLYLEAPENRIRELISDVEAVAVWLHNVAFQSEFRGCLDRAPLSDRMVLVNAPLVPRADLAFRGAGHQPLAVLGGE